MTFDWEGEMREVRSKATAAARHGEKTLSGVAEALAALGTQERRLCAMRESMIAMEARLVALNDAFLASQERAATVRTEQRERRSARLWSGAAGVTVGVILSGAFIWS